MTGELPPKPPRPSLVERAAARIEAQQRTAPADRSAPRLATVAKAMGLGSSDFPASAIPATFADAPRAAPAPPLPDAFGVPAAPVAAMPSVHAFEPVPDQSSVTALADLIIPPPPAAPVPFNTFKPAPPAPGQRRSRRDDIDLDALRSQGFIVPDSPATTIAEEFRIIKRQLLMNAMMQGSTAIRNGNLILVCSSQPNEGKTFCAINLALSIASERDLTVLLVDADFAKPEVLSILGLEGGKGLVDIIIDPTLDLAECMIRTNIENFSVLPAGRQHNLTTELLASDRMGELIEEIAQRYNDRIVVFDSPPVLASSAAPVLAMHVGQTVYVVAAEQTDDAQVREGLGLLSACEHRHLLLNMTRFGGAGRRYGTYYGYGV